MLISKDADPLVTIICLCYNHERFIAEALQSVMDQTYQQIQLIVVDDFSKDGSVSVITNFLKRYPSIVFLQLPHNMGMTKAFNKALILAKGEFIVDFAGDDVLHPERIEKQVRSFQQLDNSYGVVFSDAWLTDKNSKVIGTFYKRSPDGTLLEKVPSGNIYLETLHRYCVCAPTIMSRKMVYEDLKGYDEMLVYEDFDFFIRSTRKYNYWYQDELLTYYRQSPESESKQFYRKSYNPHLASTLAVCRKAHGQNISEAENEALAHRVRYLLRQSFFTENFSLVKDYLDLLHAMRRSDIISQSIAALARLRIRTGFLFFSYMKFRQLLSGKAK
ncbi:glycosyltransferase [Cytophagaceae bacterium YF14B1]|uniref:Glycosyltransferase n=1 Tax=Xanthocytophaga flava TaxID=3048013 RepID=A0AAE3QHP1_9BACT|nr:glycosyltransferase [Xanthocytophaga flavus]MDJ1479557.1 glycosyltransferase [Xanthocytophaga flavus]